MLDSIMRVLVWGFAGLGVIVLAVLLTDRPNKARIPAKVTCTIPNCPVHHHPSSTVPAVSFPGAVDLDEDGQPIDPSQDD